MDNRLCPAPFQHWLTTDRKEIDYLLRQNPVEPAPQLADLHVIQNCANNLRNNKAPGDDGTCPMVLEMPMMETRNEASLGDMPCVRERSGP